MAISKMQKISLIASRSSINHLLKSVQCLQQLEIVELKDRDDLENFRPKSINLVEQFNAQELTKLYDSEALSYINQRRQRIEGAINQLESKMKKESIIKRMRTEKPTYTYDELESNVSDEVEYELVKKVNDLFTEIDKATGDIKNLQAEIDQLDKWKKLSVTPNAAKKFNYVKALVGTIPNTDSNHYYNQLKNNPSLDHEVVFLNDVEYGVVLFTNRIQSNELAEVLANLHFEPYSYEYDELPCERIERLNLQIQTKKEFLDTTQETINSYKSDLEQLKVQYDYVTTLYDRETAKFKLGYSEHLVGVQGWIEAEKSQEFVTTLTQTFGNQVSIQVLEVEESDIEEVPIKLKNNKLVKPFEMITSMYALPKYNEIDPTPFVAPFYFVFFGMMVADLGYGLIIVLGALLALKLFKLEPKMKGTMQFGVLIGISTMFWGVMYGSFFGFTLPVVPINTSTDVMTMLGLSIGLGLIHIFVALGINIYLKLRAKAYLDAYSDGIAWVLLIIGLLMLAVGMMLEGYAWVGTIGMWLAIINAIGIVASPMIRSKSAGSIGWGLYNLYGVSSYLGDLVSYTRLMALGLSGGSIAMAFNMIIGFLPPVGRFTIGILLFVFLHAFNIFLSMLSGYVHSIRLVFVEFFSKFYEGGGKPFSPLSISNRFIDTDKK